ncbi:MAG: hypothetical protein Q7R33_02810 [Nitrosarchaeum sp.]|nr:hypothetical protein [Nitrosarchaeum sp.]
MKTFFILSLKWTNQKDKFFTFWQEHCSGYCYRKTQIGIYPEKDIDQHPDYFNNKKDTLAIPTELIEAFWIKMKNKHNDEIDDFLPNNTAIRDLLKITPQQLLQRHKTDFCDWAATFSVNSQRKTFAFHAFTNK